MVVTHSRTAQQQRLGIAVVTWLVRQRQSNLYRLKAGRAAMLLRQAVNETIQYTYSMIKRGSDHL